MGRPSSYSEALAEEICSRLSEGASLRTICGADDMPDARTVFRWLSADPSFCQQYARARAASEHAIFEEILAIADDSSGDYIETPKGRIVDNENIQRSRLRIDARKWILARMNPKKYGDRVGLAAAEEGNQLQIIVTYAGRKRPKEED